MAAQPTHRYPLLEIARVRNGQIIITHGPNCASRAGGMCGCNPSYRLQRIRKARGR